MILQILIVPVFLKSINQALLVGKDFGALLVFILAALHPERVAGVVTLGIPFMVPGPSVVQMIDNLPNGFYVKRWQVIPSLQSRRQNKDIIFSLRTMSGDSLSHCSI